MDEDRKEYVRGFQTFIRIIIRQYFVIGNPLQKFNDKYDYRRCACSAISSCEHVYFLLLVVYSYFFKLNSNNNSVYSLVPSCNNLTNRTIISPSRPLSSIRDIAILGFSVSCRMCSVSKHFSLPHNTFIFYCH